jgi:DNA-binding MarR family transcriptional regulator
MVVSECRAGTPPPGATPEEALVLEMGMTYWALRGAFERYVGFTQARLHLLGAVFMAGELSQAQLQRSLDVDAAAVTRQVKQLEADGLLTRRPDPADNRFMLVALTPRGRQTLLEVAERGRTFVSRLLNGIDSGDLACMQRVLADLRRNANGPEPQITHEGREGAPGA